MQLVTESDDTDVFFSEKTATPMFLNKPFLVAGRSAGRPRQCRRLL